MNKTELNTNNFKIASDVNMVCERVTSDRFSSAMVVVRDTKLIIVGTSPHRQYRGLHVKPKPNIGPPGTSKACKQNTNPSDE